jgi:hypothetical protein
MSLQDVHPAYLFAFPKAATGRPGVSGCSEYKRRRDGHR